MAGARTQQHYSVPRKACVDFFLGVIVLDMFDFVAVTIAEAHCESRAGMQKDGAFRGHHGRGPCVLDCQFEKAPTASRLIMSRQESRQL